MIGFDSLSADLIHFPGICAETGPVGVRKLIKINHQSLYVQKEFRFRNWSNQSSVMICELVPVRNLVLMDLTAFGCFFYSLMS